MAKNSRDKKLARTFYDMNCLVCNYVPCDPDHIINQKGIRELDFKDNIWPLCRKHHTQKGAMGLTSFARKNGLEAELIRRGLEFNELKQSWFWPKIAKESAAMTFNPREWIKEI